MLSQVGGPIISLQSFVLLLKKMREHAAEKTVSSVVVFFKLHCQSKAKLKFVMCLQALKGKKNPITSFCCMQGKGKRKNIYINNWQKSVCTLGHDCLNALPHTDQYRFYSWPLALEAEGKPDLATLSHLSQQSAAAPGLFPAFLFFFFFSFYLIPLVLRTTTMGRCQWVGGEHQTRGNSGKITVAIVSALEGINHLLRGFTQTQRRGKYLHTRTNTLCLLF